MLKEYYLKNVNKVVDLNCAESVVFTADKVYNLELSPESIHLSSAFGGGMFIEGKCGAVTGALMIIGYVFVKENAHSTGFLKEIVHTFFNDYEKLMGSCECAPLKKKHRTEEYGCRDVIAAALDVLEEIIIKYSDKRVR